LIALHSSLRLRSPQETLAHGRKVAHELGLSLPVDITDQDEIGIPVFLTKNENASEDQRAFAMGKGLEKVEAEVGALMESIEIALATFRKPPLRPPMQAAGKTWKSQEKPDALLDFCPLLGAEIDSEMKIGVVEGRDIRSGKSYQLPAEAVFLAYTADPPLFGSHSNGLSSGNSREEASLHGLLELIERDINSFQEIKAQRKGLSPASLPPKVIQLYHQILASGNDLLLHYNLNEFDIPHITALLLNKTDTCSFPIHMGYGCHFVPEIAMIRAITEAAQARLGHILGLHGNKEEQSFNQKQKIALIQTYKKEHEALSSINAVEIRRLFPEKTSIGEYLDLLCSHLEKKGFPDVLQVPFSSDQEDIQVVRMLVPGLEFFTPRSRKVGPRLAAYANRMRAR